MPHYQTTDTFALVSDHKSDRSRQIHTVHGLSAHICADEPDAFLLQFFNGSYNICYFCNRCIVDRTGGCLRYCGSQSDSTSLRYDNAMRAGQVRCTDDRTEIVRIFYIVQKDQKRRFTLLFCLARMSSTVLYS